MSISPQPKSNEPSRPPSPAADALEVLSLDDEAITPEEANRMKANHRKSSSWKGFKNQLTKAEMKIKNTLRKGSVVMEGTALSPSEFSPESIDSNPTTPENEENEKKIERMSELIKNIEELGNEYVDKELLQTSAVTNNNTNNNSNRKEFTTKRVDFIEEPCKKVSMSAIEGANVSRPNELSLETSSMSPIAPPRMKKDGSKRLERLRSVPNLMLNRQDQTRLQNIRKGANIEHKSITKNKGNFMRRFSKY
jgi:hypothetical protein